MTTVIVTYKFAVEVEDPTDPAELSEAVHEYMNSVAWALDDPLDVEIQS